jgi:hypothetical protein
MQGITSFGTLVLNYSFLSPLLAASIVQFTQQSGKKKHAAVFATFVFYFIKNCDSLVPETTSPEQIAVVCPDSRIVTLSLAFTPFFLLPNLDAEVGRLTAPGFQAVLSWNCVITCLTPGHEYPREECRSLPSKHGLAEWLRDLTLPPPNAARRSSPLSSFVNVVGFNDAAFDQRISTPNPTRPLHQSSFPAAVLRSERNTRE